MRTWPDDRIQHTTRHLLLRVTLALCYATFLNPGVISAHPVPPDGGVSASRHDAAPSVPLPGLHEFAHALAHGVLSPLPAAAENPLAELRRLVDVLPAKTAEAAAVEPGNLRTALAAALALLPHSTLQLGRGGILPSSSLAETSPPLRLVRGRGMILLHVETTALDALLPRTTDDGDPGTSISRLATVLLDLSKTTEPVPPPAAVVAPCGTSWVLVDVRNAPPGPTVVRVVVRRTDEPSTASGVVWHRVVEVPPSARLRVALSEGGTSVPSGVPAMVRLTCLDDGSLHAPPNAVDFYDQSAAIAGGNGAPDRGEAIPHRLGTSIAGGYWCVPGSFDATLPAGRWELRVFRGHETVPVTETFQLAAGTETLRQVRLRRWIDMAARGWYSGDDHVHSRLVSDEDARRLLLWCSATDIRVANILAMGNHIQSFYEQRGYGPAWRTTDGTHHLVPGQEDPRFFMGHALGLNLAERVRPADGYLHNDRIADVVRAGGGVYGHAHLVRRHASFNVEYDMTLMCPDARSDFGEVMQAGLLGTEIWYDFLNLGYRLPASAGSDMPYGSALGEVRVYARVGHKPFSTDAWFDAFRLGRTFVTNGPMLELDVQGREPGDEITLAAADQRATATLRVRANAMGLPGSSAPKRLAVVMLGETVREVVSTDAGRGSLDLEFDLPTGFGGWVAATAEGHDGSLAHTSPVYLKRPGFRPWAWDKAPELLAKRFATLNQVEGLLTVLSDAMKQGRLGPQDYYNRLVASQAPWVLQRVKKVRGMYQELNTVRESERAAREQGSVAEPAPTLPARDPRPPS